MLLWRAFANSACSSSRAVHADVRGNPWTMGRRFF
jgi:hypothetical protein